MSTPAEKIDTGQETTETTETPVSEPTWPENWRELSAGEDETKLSMLSRYTSPTAAMDALVNAQNKIRSGELKTPFPEDGTDEQKTQWRIDNGLPEGPDKYDLTFDDGLVVGDDDKPIIDEFLKSAYENNMSPGQVKGTIKWYYDLINKEEEILQQKDAEEKQAVEDKLHAEWGNDYRGNMNRIDGMLALAPEGLKDQILNGRLEDGTPIKANLDAMKFLADLAVQLNPTTTLIPGMGADKSGIEDEIAKIEKVLRTDRKAYNADQNMQDRYHDLLAARERFQKR